MNSAFANRCRFYARDVINKVGSMKNENKAYLHYIDWSVNREDPAILDVRDYQNLKKSDALFARKFDENKSKDLLDMIDQCCLK